MRRPRRRRGRPSKVESPAAEMFLDAIMLGATNEEAVAHASEADTLSIRTVYRWLGRGEFPRGPRLEFRGFRRPSAART